MQQNGITELKADTTWIQALIKKTARTENRLEKAPFPSKSPLLPVQSPSPAQKKKNLVRHEKAAY